MVKAPQSRYSKVVLTMKRKQSIQTFKAKWSKLNPHDNERQKRLEMMTPRFLQMLCEHMHKEDSMVGMKRVRKWAETHEWIQDPYGVPPGLNSGKLSPLKQTLAPAAPAKVNGSRENDSSGADSVDTAVIVRPASRQLNKVISPRETDSKTSAKKRSPMCLRSRSEVGSTTSQSSHRSRDAEPRKPSTTNKSARTKRTAVLLERYLRETQQAPSVNHPALVSVNSRPTLDCSEMVFGKRTPGSSGAHASSQMDSSPTATANGHTASANEPSTTANGLSDYIESQKSSAEGTASNHDDFVDRPLNGVPEGKLSAIDTMVVDDEVPGTSKQAYAFGTTASSQRELVSLISPWRPPTILQFYPEIAEEVEIETESSNEQQEEDPLNLKGEDSNCSIFFNTSSSSIESSYTVTPDTVAATIFSNVSVPPQNHLNILSAEANGISNPRRNNHSEETGLFQKVAPPTQTTMFSNTNNENAAACGTEERLEFHSAGIQYTLLLAFLIVLTPFLMRVPMFPITPIIFQSESLCVPGVAGTPETGNHFIWPPSPSFDQQTSGRTGTQPSSFYTRAHYQVPFEAPRIYPNATHQSASDQQPIPSTSAAASRRNVLPQRKGTSMPLTEAQEKCNSIRKQFATIMKTLSESTNARTNNIYIGQENSLSSKFSLVGLTSTALIKISELFPGKKSLAQTTQHFLSLFNRVINTEFFPTANGGGYRTHYPFPTPKIIPKFETVTIFSDEEESPLT